MQLHQLLTDKELLAQFESCELPPMVFSHEAHLRLSYLYLKQEGIEQAIAKITSAIKHYVQYLGVQDKYNETLTVVAVRVVYHYMLKGETKSFTELIDQYPSLITKYKKLLAQHYGFNIFQSEKAKEIYLEPDLLAFN